MHPATENLLKFFRYEHLPKDLQETSKVCHDLAYEMVTTQCAQSAELTAGLRKLLEAKDCFVRARLEKLNEV